MTPAEKAKLIDILDHLGQSVLYLEIDSEYCRCDHKTLDLIRELRDLFDESTAPATPEEPPAGS
jgi:hypothetical protein